MIENILCFLSLPLLLMYVLLRVPNLKGRIYGP